MTQDRAFTDPVEDATYWRERAHYWQHRCRLQAAQSVDTMLRMEDRRREEKNRADAAHADAEASNTELQWLLAERHAAGTGNATTGDAAWPWWRNPAFITIAVLLGAVVGVLSWRVTDYAANLISGGR